MMRIIEYRQPGRRMGHGIDAEQDLIRELIAGGCCRLSKRNIKDIAVGIVGDTDRPYRFSPPLR
jgi:hypothetical protein